jgi:hypothetical protein
MTPAKLKTLLIVLSVLIISGPILDNWYSLVRYDPPNIGPFSPLQVIRGIFFVILVVLLSKYILKSVKVLPITKPIIAMSLFLFLLMPFHQTPLENSVYIFQMLYISMYLIGGFVIGFYYKYSDKWLIRVGKITLLVIIILQIYGYTQGSSFYSEYALVGLGDRPGVTAAALASLIPILILRIYKMRLPDWIILGIALISLTMTMRRSAILGVLISFVGVAYILLINKNIRVSKILSRTLTIFLLLLGIVYTIISTPLADEYKYRIDDMIISEGGTGSGRLIFWEAALISSVNRSELKIILGEGFG